MTITNAGLNDHSQIDLSLDFQNIKSYSVYQKHAVAVDNNGSPLAIGDNYGWPIYKTLPKNVNRWTYFQIQDRSRNIYQVESAVCGMDYTLYLLDQSYILIGNSFAYVKKGKNNGFPVFLSTGGNKIYSIYGGRTISAAIDYSGIIHIIDDSIYYNNFQTRCLYLPWANMPISIAFEGDCVIALSSLGNVYDLNLNYDDTHLHTTEGLPSCSFISGTAFHCIAVTKDGDVYARGSNRYDQLGLGRNTIECDEFRQIGNLRSQEITEAYAGEYHSFFVNSNGKVFGCGSNSYGELFRRQTNNNVVQAAGTNINSGANFIIAGCEISVAFVDCDPPENSPNQILGPFNNNPFPLMFEDIESLNQQVRNLLEEKNQNAATIDNQNRLIENLRRENAKNSKIQKQFTSVSNLLNQQQQAINSHNYEIENYKKKIVGLNREKNENAKTIEELKRENQRIRDENVYKNMRQQQTINSQNEEIERLKKEIELLKNANNGNIKNNGDVSDNDYDYDIDNDDNNDNGNNNGNDNGNANNNVINNGNVNGNDNNNNNGNGSDNDNRNDNDTGNDNNDDDDDDDEFDTDSSCDDNIEDFDS